MALVFAIVILVCSFTAQMISSDGGKVKISNVKIDVRGAVLDADLYYPAFTSEEDSLPAVVVSHGGAVSKGVMRGIADELARRGYVVLNFNAYNSGVSEMPVVDDVLDGTLDAVDYLRTLKYVDATKIILIGHSGGASRVSKAAIADCGYYTLNDLLVNELHDTFGIEFTEAEIYEDADTLAAKKLNNDQLAYFEALKADITNYYNTRVKAVFCLGSTAKFTDATQPVEVAGHEVQRNPQFSFGLLNGVLDYRKYTGKELAQAAWYVDDITDSTWYVIDDKTATSSAIGSFDDVNIVNSTELSEGFENRTVRLFTSRNNETHSKNFFSCASTSDTVKFVEQATGYNRGLLTDSATTPLNAKSNIWPWRAVLNCISMLSMIGFILSIAGVLVQNKFFAPCVAAPWENKPAFNKKRFWIIAIFNIVLTFLAIYISNKKFGPSNMLIPISWYFPLTMAADFQASFVVLLGIANLILLGVLAFLDKKDKGEPLLRLGIKVKFSSVLKSILLAFAIVSVGYLSLYVIMGLFNQDYRFWVMSFPELNPDTFLVALRYALAFFPVFLVCGAVTNYTIRDDIAAWKDDLISVCIGSAGVWICCLLNIIICRISFSGTYFSDFTCTYSTLLFVPIITYVNRRLYKLTNSIWLGGFVSALLFGWSFVGATGFTDVNMHIQTIFAVILGA